MLPVPVTGGSLDALADLVNADESTRRLIVGYLVAGLIPDLAHPILAVFGEQGTAKTSLLRLLAALLDPSPAPTRTAPRELRQWAVTASASWFVALDNVSAIPEWLSDALCRAVTGDALPDRALYTDADVSVISFRRLLAMSSIDAGALKGDLADRLLPIELDRIDPRSRRRESDLDAAVTAAAPVLLGALLDLLAAVLDRLPGIEAASLPRMADFAAVLAALDAVTGWATVDDYAGTATDLADTVIDSDPVARKVRELVPAGATWEGTPGALLDKLTPEHPPRGWPTSPRAMSGAIRRITPALRTVGTTVEHGRRSGGRRDRTITITTAPEPEDAEHMQQGMDRPSRPSPSSRQAADLHERRDGRRDGRDGAAGATVPTVPELSHPSQTVDLHKHHRGDSGDGWDGPIPYRRVRALT